MTFRRAFSVFLFSLFAFTSLRAPAQDATAPPTPPKAGSNWQRVSALPARTKVHVTTDHGGHTCRIFSVSDDALTCEGASRKAGRVIQRAEIQHIKLAHYGRSTLVGAGVGAGIGAISGAIAGRNPPCPANGFCLNIIGPGAVAVIFGVGAGAVGAVVGGTTDMARGSSIYVRP